MKSLYELENVTTVKLSQVLNSQHQTLELRIDDYDQILSCLKQRTLHAYIKPLSRIFKDLPVVIYDQDPWSAYTDDSPYKGSYKLFAEHLNIKTFAVTTKWWSDYVQKQDLPCMFVKMWVLPEYCSNKPQFVDRQITLGFIGGLHPYRKTLIQELEKLDTYTHVTKSGLSYVGFLEKMSTLQCFIHAEESCVFINGEKIRFYANWVKNVEAASRGCYSVRKFDAEAETYLGDIKTVMTYNNVEEIPVLLEKLQKMDSSERQLTIDTSVEYIREANVWQETADLLTL